MIKIRQLFGLIFITGLFVAGIGYWTGWSDEGIAFAAGVGILLILTALIMAPLINFVEQRYGKGIAIMAALFCVPLVARVLYLTVFGWVWNAIMGS